MQIILEILLIVITTYVGVGVLYNFFFATISIFYRDKKYKKVENEASIAVFIPGYKEDVIIYHVAKDALKQNYNNERYDVIVIADSFSEQTLQKLNTLPIKVMQVSFEKSTKAKSLNKVMGMLGDAYDIAVVLDADNLMKPDFLEKVNQAYQNGEMAMQGHRTAKNLNTDFARLDAISEEINNSIFRRGHWQIGLPSALIGSAMAFDYKMYREVMSKIDVVSGFDKELEIQLIKRNINVAFLNNAIVLDEKVQSGEVFEKQRTRWLAAQVNFALKYFFEGLWNLLSTGRVSLFNKALQFALLPRAFTLAGLVFLVAASFLLGNTEMLKINGLLFGLFFLAMLFSIPKPFYNAKMIGSFAYVPKAIINMLLSLLKMKKAKDSFIHTPHTHINSENQEQ